jgi:hypothetical protein
MPHYYDDHQRIYLKMNLFRMFILKLDLAFFSVGIYFIFFVIINKFYFLTNLNLIN